MANGSEVRKPRLRERQKQQTRELILAAARRLFCLHDVGNVSVNQIVEEADVGRQTFYYHFRDKEELVFHLIDDYNRNGLPIMRALPAPDPTKEQLAEWIYSFSRFLKAYKVEYSLLFQLSYHPRTQAVYGRPTTTTWVTALGERSPSFAAIVAEGEAGARARATAFRMLVNMTWAAAAAWRHADNGYGDQAVIDVVDDLYTFMHDPKYRLAPYA